VDITSVHKFNNCPKPYNGADLCMAATRAQTSTRCGASNYFAEIADSKSNNCYAHAQDEISPSGCCLNTGARWRPQWRQRLHLQISSTAPQPRDHRVAIPMSTLTATPI
jgi:hypothetical protein